jgi:hypothetical protein
MCLDAAISTDDVGIGSPEASTGVLLADISAGVGGLAVEIWGRRGAGEDRRWRGEVGAGGRGVLLTPLCVRFLGFRVRRVEVLHGLGRGLVNL